MFLQLTNHKRRRGQAPAVAGKFWVHGQINPATATSTAKHLTKVDFVGSTGNNFELVASLLRDDFSFKCYFSSLSPVN